MAGKWSEHFRSRYNLFSARAVDRHPFPHHRLKEWIRCPLERRWSGSRKEAQVKERIGKDSHYWSGLSLRFIQVMYRHLHAREKILSARASANTDPGVRI